ncbi:Cupin 2 domain-containing protein [Paraburkholderia sabiae]|uniref:cupin domain-containing protein n=1 Tax=Paraburkholderia sabiae TaxID=273251 RepID=UPI001CB34CAC|nr:cupin domain-containing protein [Paraburkholderia sabiae]CAG9229726.1 Cupin 2 domain-containing protein [Paraburkholderia sabiae]
MNIQSIVRAAGAAMAFAIAVPASAHGTTETVTPNFQHAIPNVPGKSLIAVIVDYPPGAASPVHRHAGSAFIYAYVVSGEVESQVDDTPKRVYRAGESFFEEPGAVHRISRNASKTKPAKLLAVFIADSNDQALTTPIK